MSGNYEAGGAPSTDVVFSFEQYSSVAHSPLNTAAADFQLEDFEDREFNLAGVQASGIDVVVSSEAFPIAIVDSVDGLNTESYWAEGTPGFTFEFDPEVLGGLPTEVGIAWTDGFGQVEFEAFDAAGESLGRLRSAIEDDSLFATPDDDRFFGVRNAEGVKSIRISNTRGGIEVDHLQFGSIRPLGSISGRKVEFGTSTEPAQILEPISYASESDSPFQNAVDWILEDFEDGLLNTLGVTASGEGLGRFVTVVRPRSD